MATSNFHFMSEGTIAIKGQVYSSLLSLQLCITWKLKHKHNNYNCKNFIHLKKINLL